jgi:hypothetical protein
VAVTPFRWHSRGMTIPNGPGPINPVPTPDPSPSPDPGPTPSSDPVPDVPLVPGVEPAPPGTTPPIG